MIPPKLSDRNTLAYRAARSSSGASPPSAWRPTARPRRRRPCRPSDVRLLLPSNGRVSSGESKALDLHGGRPPFSRRDPAHARAPPTLLGAIQAPAPGSLQKDPDLQDALRLGSRGQSRADVGGCPRIPLGFRHSWPRVPDRPSGARTAAWPPAARWASAPGETPCPRTSTRTGPSSRSARRPVCARPG
jgi:hypothetical protein